MNNYSTDKSERKTYECFICGSGFNRAKNQIKRLKDKRLTCSKPCSNEKMSLLNREKLEVNLGISDLKEWLKNKYCYERMNTREIALLMYGRKTHSPNVGAWLKRLGLEVRSQSESIAMQWENNPQRRKETAERMVVNLGVGTVGRNNLIAIMQTKEYRLNSSIVKRGKNNPMHGVVGEDSPRWNHELTEEDRTIGRKYKAYTDWRVSVFERDSHTCEKCSIRGGVTLAAHHLNGYDWDKENRVNIDNGITLCEDCHKDFHGNYGYGGNTKEQFDHYMSVLSDELLS